MLLRVIILVVLIMLVGVTGCRQPEKVSQPPKMAAKSGTPKPVTKPPEPDKLTGELQAAEIVWPDEKGRPLWKARLKEGDITSTGQEAAVELKNVSVDLYRDGKAASSLTAPRVTADSTTKEVTATGGVKLVSCENGTVITCEKMTWKSSEQKIYGTGRVRVERGGVVISANKVVSDTALRHAVFSD